LLSTPASGSIQAKEAKAGVCISALSFRSFSEGGRFASFDFIALLHLAERNKFFEFKRSCHVNLQGKFYVAENFP